MALASRGGRWLRRLAGRVRIDEVGTGAYRRDFQVVDVLSRDRPRVNCTGLTRCGNQKVLQLERISADASPVRVTSSKAGASS